MNYFEYDYLFGPGGETLLPATRDAYLRGTLPAADATVVETFLRHHAVERGVALARWHQLAAGAQRQLPAQPLSPPAWIGSQLQQQPSVSAWGPLRRPGLQVGLGLVLLLGGASAVQWVRNKPLVPAPVVATLKQATRSLSRATRNLVSSSPLPAPNPADSSWLALAPETPPASSVASVAVPAQRRKAATSRVAVEVERIQPAAVGAVPVVGGAATDTAAAAGVAVAPVTLSAAPARRMVRGRVVDFRGEPLVGATVLVKGTSLGTSTNANGEYSLEAPVGAELLVGFAGCDDQVLTAAANTPLDVTLEPTRGSRRRASASRY